MFLIMRGISIPETKFDLIFFVLEIINALFVGNFLVVIYAIFTESLKIFKLLARKVLILSNPARDAAQSSSVSTFMACTLTRLALVY